MNKFNSKPDLLDELQQYRRLLDNIPAELGILDLEGRFLFNTPSAIRDPIMREWAIGKNHHEYCRKRGRPKSFADNRQKYINQCINEKKLAEVFAIEPFSSSVEFSGFETPRRGSRL